MIGDAMLVCKPQKAGCLSRLRQLWSVSHGSIAQCDIKPPVVLST